MLTPTRVRGKRARHAIPVDGTTNGESQRKGVSTRTEEPRVTDPAPPTKTLSRLETLPVELMEKIFLYCLEVNLPRASPYVATSLTSERIYRLLILLSFWDNDHATQLSNYEPPDEILKMFRSITYKPLYTEERTGLQAAILDCRWCTQDRIKRQIPALFYLKAQSIGWINNMEESDKVEFDKIIWEGTWATYEGGLEYELQIKPPFELNVTMPFYPSPVNCRPVSVQCFPNKLLHGKPWTDEKLSFLQFLSKAYGHNHAGYNVLFPFHTAQEGIHDAIVEQNARALRHLLRLDELFSRINNFKTHRSSFYQLPAEHFRTAVRHSADDPEILKLLVRGSAESIPYDDIEITEWATEAQERGDPFGKWLLDLMLLLPSAVNDSSSANDRPSERQSLFEHGKPVLGSMNHTEDGIRAMASIFGQDLNSWKEELDIP